MLGVRQQPVAIGSRQQHCDRARFDLEVGLFFDVPSSNVVLRPALAAVCVFATCSPPSGSVTSAARQSAPSGPFAFSCAWRSSPWPQSVNHTASVGFLLKSLHASCHERSGPFLISGDFFRRLRCPSPFSGHLLWDTPKLTLRRRLYCGQRIGEALHPGPRQQSLLTSFFGNQPEETATTTDKRGDTCVFAVVNPTSVLHKAHLFQELGADVVLMSETSAVSRVQQVTGQALSKLGFRCHWGHAVACHSRAEDTGPTLRGLAAGVAIASRLPSRKSRPDFAADVLATCRLTEAFVRLGALEVRLITIYGCPLSQLDARERSEELLQHALHRATQNAMPCIVGGDFNLCPSDLPAGQAFLRLGYQEVFEWHHRQTGLQLPPTCRNSTRHDTALIHPDLLPLLCEAWVETDKHLFDAHAPLCFRMKLCGHRPCHNVWRVPRPWGELCPDFALVEKAFLPFCPDLRAQALQCASTDCVDAALQAFSQRFERAVDTAIRQAHAADPVRQPGTCLPKSFRGRCRHRAPVRRELTCLAKPDRAGGYTPDVEVTSVLGRLKVRQVRRIQTLYKGLKKAFGTGVPLSPAQRAQFGGEWCAICRATGYTPSFPHWTLRVAAFAFFPVALPELDWLHDLLQYVQFDCDGLVRQQARLRADTFRQQVQLDIELGSSRQGYRAVRPPAHPPFTEVPVTVQAKVKAQVDSAGTDCWYHLETLACFRPCAPATVNGVACQVQDQQGNCVWLTAADAAAPLPVEGCLCQSYVACTAPELHAAFMDYWGPIWQRDAGPAQHLDAWPVLKSFLQRCESQVPAAHIRSFAPDLWRAAIRRMSVRKATGICGWSPGDLKLLPDCALEILNHVFHQAVTCGLPAPLLMTRVGVLAKKADPESMKHSRPIIVFSCLYRIWASVTARQILRAWAPHFPRSITGSLPHRSSRDLSYRQQQRIETSLLSSVPRLGLSIDIIKCFNQLGWAPLRAILLWLRLPTDQVDFWLCCLRRHTRSSVFLRDVSAAHHCWNGAPEGDPMSVVAMVGICYLASLVCSHDNVEFESYVDNWSWATPSRSALSTMMPLAVDFLAGLSLPIDVGKSYVWATKRADRLWLKSNLTHLFPGPAQPTIVSEVRDLGVAFRFDGSSHRVCRNQRLLDGLDRLDRLRQQPRPPTNKAFLVQTGVWPQCFYGIEGHCHSLAELQQARGAAARAIVGHYKVMSPHLTFGVLADVVQDPFVYCLERQLTAFRRACLHDPDTAMAILEVVCRSAPPRSAQGPATALRISLDRLGLQLTVDTCLKGLDNTRVYLDRCHTSDIKELLQRSWALYLQHQVMHRNGLLTAPPVFSVPVVKLLRPLPGPQQAVLLRHLTGAFSSAAAKSLWDDAADDRCQLCGARQTKEHKFVSCPALAHVRAPWWPHVQLAFARWPFLLHCPASTYPDDLEVAQLIFHTRQLPAPALDLSRWGLPGSRGFLRFFTDGSCRRPKCPLTRHAAFSVVLDTTTSDDEIPTVLAEWRSSGVLPSQFAVISTGLVPRRQSIDRAELCAVILALRSAYGQDCHEVEVWTDSQYVLTVWSRLEDCTGLANPDLCHQLRLLRRPGANLKKVASHQKLDELWGFPQWCAIGNVIADLAAKEAVAADLSCVHDVLEAAHRHVQEQTDLLRLLWKYLLALSEEENRLLKNRGLSDQGSQCRGEEAMAAPVDLAVLPTSSAGAASSARPQTPLPVGWLQLNDATFTSRCLPALPRDVLLACSWPPWFTVPLWQWLRGLRWTTGPSGGRCPAGVSYLELLLDFTLSTGVLPPESLALATTTMTAPLTWPRPVTLRQFKFVLVEAVRQLERLSGVVLFGPKRNKVFSLRHFHVHLAQHGLPCRPFFRQAHEVGQLLASCLQLGTARPLQDIVRGYTGAWHHNQELQHAWGLLSTANRAVLASSLRKSRS